MEAAAAAGALAKEDIVVPIGGLPTAEKELLIARLDCDRFTDAALSESIEAAGETPSDRYERLRRC